MDAFFRDSVPILFARSIFKEIFLTTDHFCLNFDIYIIFSKRFSCSGVKKGLIKTRLTASLIDDFKNNNINCVPLSKKKKTI
jgi:hypothetical protein